MQIRRCGGFTFTLIAAETVHCHFTLCIAADSLSLQACADGFHDCYRDPLEKIRAGAYNNGIERPRHYPRGSV